jgi:hypothetical protein
MQYRRYSAVGSRSVHHDLQQRRYGGEGTAAEEVVLTPACPERLKHKSEALSANNVSTTR